MSTLENLRFEGGHHVLNDWVLVAAHGNDAQSFLQRQTTNNLSVISENKAVLTTRLNRTGQLVSFFYVFAIESQCYLLVPEELVRPTLDDLNKYIIMDDIELVPKEEMKATLYFGLAALKYYASSPQMFFYGDEVRISLAPPNEQIPKVSVQELELLRLLNGYPRWNEEITTKNFINDCRLNEVAIDYKKGCFLGQETVAKINNNRSVAFYPTLLETPEYYSVSPMEKFFGAGKKMATGFAAFSLGEKNYLYLSLHREYRINQLPIELERETGEIIKGVVRYFPYFKAQTFIEKSVELFENGANLFQEGHVDEAIQKLQMAIEFDRTNAEAYEALGVIYGRLEDYEKAIELMNELERLDPTSVMAHTNKSLFLMKLGRIEEAEEQKSLATLKSFDMYGKVAQEKEQKEAMEKEKEAEILKRSEMFKQVLEIDPEDELANYGMADVSFFLKDYQTSVDYLSKVLKNNPKYSVAYLLLGKAYEALSKKSQARETYLTGIEVAKLKGDLMPANEMQSRLNQLSH